MPDTVRTRAELEALLADNASGEISAQDVRDFLKSLDLTAESDAKLTGKSNVGHNHDDRYYTEAEIITLLAGVTVDTSGLVAKPGAYMPGELMEFDENGNAISSGVMASYLNDKMDAVNPTGYNALSLTVFGNPNKTITFDPSSIGTNNSVNILDIQESGFPFLVLDGEANLTVYGNITSGNGAFYGDGSGLTGVPLPSHDFEAHGNYFADGNAVGDILYTYGMSGSIPQWRNASLDGLVGAAGYIKSSALSGYVTLTGTQTLTNKSMSGSSNTFSNIPQSAVTNLTDDIGSINDGLTNLSDYATSIESSVVAHTALTTAHGATDANMASRIVMRDASGNFSAGQVGVNVLKFTEGQWNLAGSTQRLLFHSDGINYYKSGAGNGHVFRNATDVAMLTVTGSSLATTATAITSSGTELVLSQTGDAFGASSLTLRNRNGETGAMFKGATNDLVDFIFSNPGETLKRNIRFEARAPQCFVASPEFQFGTPANPSLVVADTGVLVRQPLVVKTNGWNIQTDEGQQRMYFTSGNTNYYKAGTGAITTAAHVWRNSLEADLMSVTGLGEIYSAGNFNGSSGTQYGMRLRPSVNQTSTAGYSVLEIDPQFTASGSGTKRLIDAKYNGNRRFDVDIFGNAYVHSTLQINGGQIFATDGANSSSVGAAGTSLHLRSGYGGQSAAGGGAAGGVVYLHAGNGGGGSTTGGQGGSLNLQGGQGGGGGSSNAGQGGSIFLYGGLGGMTESGSDGGGGSVIVRGGVANGGQSDGLFGASGGSFVINYSGMFNNDIGALIVGDSVARLYNAGEVPVLDWQKGLTLPDNSVTPDTPTPGIECRFYMRNDKFVLQYNDGGTVRYKYLDLTGTGVTWTHSTTAP